jgi:hypothetical protein
VRQAARRVQRLGERHAASGPNGAAAPLERVQLGTARQRAAERRGAAVAQRVERQRERAEREQQRRPLATATATALRMLGRDECGARLGVHLVARKAQLAQHLPGRAAVLVGLLPRTERPCADEPRERARAGQREIVATHVEHADPPVPVGHRRREGLHAALANPGVVQVGRRELPVAFQRIREGGSTTSANLHVSHLKRDLSVAREPANSHDEGAGVRHLRWLRPVLPWRR